MADDLKNTQKHTLTQIDANESPGLGHVSNDFYSVYIILSYAICFACMCASVLYACLVS